MTFSPSGTNFILNLLKSFLTIPALRSDPAEMDHGQDQTGPAFRGTIFLKSHSQKVSE